MIKMTTQQTAAQIMNSMKRITPPVDYAKELTKENHQFNYGSVGKTYFDKVFDIASTKVKEVGNYLKDSFKKAEDVSKNLYNSIIDNQVNMYSLQPAYSSAGNNGYKDRHCEYC